MFHWKRFNTYLLLALAITLACGCQSTETKKKKQLATLRLYVETNIDNRDHSQVVSIIRENPFDIRVEKTPFITEGNVTEAKVINAVGGFAISLQFDTQGKWLLEQYTAANPGRKIAIFSQFGKDLGKNRWLAAPVIPKRISNGLLIFTPDASR